MAGRSQGLRPLIHPSAWTAPQLVDRPEWTHTLDPDERTELTTLAGATETSGSEVLLFGRPYHHYTGEAEHLPLVSKRLRRIQEELETGSGAVRLRGLPLKGLTEAQCRAIFWAVSVHLGTPITQSADGDRIFSVRDAGFGDDDPRSRGPNTKKRLSFHTDRSNVVGFMCLRQARSGGENEIASSMTVYNEILRRRPDLLDVLFVPFYYLRHSVDLGNDRPWCRQPVFSFAGGHFACCFLRVLIERAHHSPDLPDLSGKQKEALDFLEAVAEEPGVHLRFTQSPGDLLLINNWVVLHRRRAFEDDDDPNVKRLILRLWLSMPNSRPLDPVFRENWGAVEAGAVRGGMRRIDTQR